jgi:hypothetical protein
MGAAERFVSRPLSRQAMLLAFWTVLFLLSLGLLYRALVHVDVAVVPRGDPSSAVALMQQLDGLDVDYRLRKDGTILVDSTEASLLMQTGIPFADARSEPPWLSTVFPIALMLLSGIAALYAGRGIFRRPQKTRRVRATAANGTDDTVTTPARASAASEPPVPNAAAPETMTARLLEAEHPQTIAVYLLGLPSEAAAAALEAVSAPLREQVWMRMASSGECDPALRRRIAELFSAKMQQLRRRLRPAEVTAKMVAIFRRLSPETRRELLTMLRREDAGDEIIALLEA